MISHKKKFGVYHWDTFDNETLLINEFDTLPAAEIFVESQYKGRISPNGADKVEIVDRRGNILRFYSVE